MDILIEDTEELKRVIDDAPAGATYYVITQYDFTEGYFKLDDELNLHAYAGNGKWNLLEHEVDIAGNYEVHALSDLKEILQLRENTIPQKEQTINDFLVSVFSGGELDASELKARELWSSLAKDYIDKLKAAQAVIKYTGMIKTDGQGTECEFEFEMPGSATKQEIEDEARETAFNDVDWGYHLVEPDDPGRLKFAGEIKTSKVGSECKFEFEVTAGASESQIENEARDEAFNHVEWTYQKVDSDDAE